MKSYLNRTKELVKEENDKEGHYLPEAPQRTHGGEVRWVGVFGQQLVLREVGLGPTNVDPLVDRHLQQERAPQEDPLPTRRH
jgi:hypothetical protein